MDEYINSINELNSTIPKILPQLQNLMQDYKTEIPEDPIKQLEHVKKSVTFAFALHSMLYTCMRTSGVDYSSTLSIKQQQDRLKLYFHKVQNYEASKNPKKRTWKK